MPKKYLAVALAALAACQSPSSHPETATQTPLKTAPLYHEPHRPQFHFSPKENWMNDPNGLVYENGTYHLFFQQNPTAPVAGNIHWGHATSADLVHWQQQPTALAPDSLGLIFSGSAVLDAQNTSGLGQPGHPPLVAIFTSHSEKREKQGRQDVENQSIAYSLDHGQTWTKYAQNPVLKNQGSRDFRDPKVAWYAPGSKWLMALSAHDHIEFYSSKNLITWTKESDFGRELGGHGGVWECPDLIKVKDEQGQLRDVLLVNMNPGGPNGGSATQYFVGSFDGKTFKATQPGTRWLDYGPDNYAGVTWTNLPAGSPTTLIGWMSNWEYCQQAPTSPWRSAMTVPRTLVLRGAPGQMQLASQPIAELNKLFENPVTLDNVAVNGRYDLSKSLKDSTGRYRLKFTIPQAQTWAIVLSNAAKEQVTIGYDAAKKDYYFDRSKSGNVTFAPAEKGFAKVAHAPRAATGPTQEIILLVDAASAELFADGGTTCLTGTFFPSQPLTGLALQANGLTVPKVELSGVRSIWDK
ncbi:MAG: glycoside hydrolase family 32 protein [Janthinobacterium lividum]